MWAAALILLAQAAATPELERFRKLDEAQRAQPQNPQATKAWLDEAARLATQAGDLIETKRYQEAVTLLRATERALQHAPSWNNLRGYAEFKSGNAKAGLQYLQQALRMEPGNEDYLLDVGEFLGEHRAYGEAVKLFEVGAARMPQSVRVQFGLAVSYILLNRRDRAQELLEQLVQGAPRFEPAYKALGECYEDAGNHKRMAELGRALRGVNPRNGFGWYLEGAGMLAEGRAEAGSVDRALAALKQAVTIEPGNARTHFVLARALQESGADQEAIAELRTTLKLDPGHERAHYVLGRLYQKVGQAEQARIELEKHKQIKERDRNAQYRRLLITMRDGG